MGSAPDAPVQIVAINKKAETVTLKNVGSEAVDLMSWVMCSIKGGQQHTIGGTLGTGEEKTFENTGAISGITANATGAHCMTARGGW